MVASARLYCSNKYSVTLFGAVCFWSDGKLFLDRFIILLSDISIGARDSLYTNTGTS